MELEGMGSGIIATGIVVVLPGPCSSSQCRGGTSDQDKSCLCPAWSRNEGVPFHVVPLDSFC